MVGCPCLVFILLGSSTFRQHQCQLCDLDPVTPGCHSVRFSAVEVCTLDYILKKVSDKRTSPNVSELMQTFGLGNNWGMNSNKNPFVR